jgi:TonB family protein
MATTKQIVFLIAVLLVSKISCAQEIVNIVYVGDNGVTENIKEAHSFVAVKHYPGGIFERLDYKLGAPIVMLRTYNDSDLSILEGKYLKYFESGNLQVNGQYHNNQKTGDWLYYNDSGRTITKETYKDNVLVQTENLDIVRKEDTKLKGDEREAEFQGGDKAWRKYLIDAMLKKPESLSSLKGEIRVMFTVNPAGKLTEIYLKKSTQFGLDEEALKIIRLSPLWKPAFQNGHSVNAYRIQPITYQVDER